MTWDADGNRVSFTSSEGTGTWEYAYDTTAGIPAVIGEVWPDTYRTCYIREPNGALIARMAGTTGASMLYYHFDALGSTRLLTDSTGAVTDTYSYDAWGSLTSHSGVTSQPYQYVGQLGYYTHYQDSNLPMLQLGVRFYDPETGRFTQLDPLRDGSNWYTYGEDAPTTKVDPKGLAAAKLPGRYVFWCGDLKGVPVWLCKCLVNQVCNRAVRHCCSDDLSFCYADCEEQHGYAPDRIYQACRARCELLHKKCLIDGGAFR